MTNELTINFVNQKQEVTDLCLVDPKVERNVAILTISQFVYVFYLNF